MDIVWLVIMVFALQVGVVAGFIAWQYYRDKHGRALLVGEAMLHYRDLTDSHIRDAVQAEIEQYKKGEDARLELALAPYVRKIDDLRRQIEELLLRIRTLENENAILRGK